MKVEEMSRVEVVAPSTVFATPAYLTAYRRVFGAGRTFHRVRAGSSGAWLQTRGTLARRLEWWGAGIHDLGGPLLKDRASVEPLWRKVQDLVNDCDGANLAQLPVDSPFVALAQRDDWSIEEAETCPVLVLPPTWDAYVSSLGKNMREQIKRYPKRLEREFSVCYERAETSEQVSRALDDLFRLHGKRWRARGQTGVLATPKRQKFQRVLCEKLRRGDALRLWTLRLNDQPACVLLFYKTGARLEFFIGGFEPSLQRWSVGTCAFARAIHDAIEENAIEIDFLRGEEDYKYRLGAQNRAYVSLRVFADSPRAHFLRRQIALEDAAMRAIHERFSAAKQE